MLTKEEMQQYVYDPSGIQNYILDKIEESTNGDINIVDPTNPFTMLLESTAVACSSPILEMKNHIRQIYPSLANTKEELYRHLTDDTLVNMFAIPSEAVVAIYVNMIDLQQNGYRPVGAEYVEMTLPEYTEIIVADTYFTLLNDIVIKLYDNGTVFIEQQISESDISITDIGILNNVVTSGNAGDSWILFETKVRQVSRTIVNDTIIAGEGYNKNIAINDQYYYVNVSYKNALTGNVFTRLKLTHDDSFIDPYTPTAIIKEIDGGINVSIPDVYLIDGGVSGNIEIDVYDTKGALYLPINNYTLEDYQINLGNTGKNESTAVSPSITLLANSRYVVDGGKDSLTTEEIRNSIIYNTKGSIDLPITEYDIARKATFNGYELFKAMDIITDRLYIASKNTTLFKTNVINSRADLFNNTTRVILADYLNNSNVYIDNDIFIIKSGTVFKEVNNLVTIIDDNELTYITNMSTDKKINYFKDKKYFITPYYYVLDKTNDSVESRIYDLDNPEIANIKITDKNINVTPRVNIDKYLIEKIDSGYRLIVQPVMNEGFDNINLSNLYIQVMIPIVDSTEYVYYNIPYDIASGYFIVNINTNFYINKNNILELTNGIANLSNRYVNLNSGIIMFTYTTDNNIVDNSNFMYDYIKLADKLNLVVYTRETYDITFGLNYQYMWNRIHNEYSERQYLKYTEDVPMVYTEDVYRKDSNNGTIVLKDSNGDIYFDKIHTEGDVVLDVNGDIVYKYKKGDVVLDNDGLPVIDQINGVVRFIDIFMIEYEYILANNLLYNNYYKLLLSNIKNWLTVQVKELNDKTLENTNILFKSYKSALPVAISVNNTNYKSTYSVSPDVVLYTTTNEYTIEEFESMKNIVGSIIHDELDKTTIKISDIKSNIINTLGSDVVGVKITGLDNIGDLEVFNIVDRATRLTINKVLSKNNIDELIVNYDITLNIQKV